MKPIIGVYTRWMEKALFEVQEQSISKTGDLELSLMSILVRVQAGLLGDPLGSPERPPVPEPCPPVSAEALVDCWVSSATAALSSPSTYSLDFFKAPPPAHLYPPLPQAAHEPSALEKVGTRASTRASLAVLT